MVSVKKSKERYEHSYTTSMYQRCALQTEPQPVQNVLKTCPRSSVHMFPAIQVNFPSSRTLGSGPKRADLFGHQGSAGEVMDTCIEAPVYKAGI